MEKRGLPPQEAEPRAGRLKAYSIEINPHTIGNFTIDTTPNGKKVIVNKEKQPVSRNYPVIIHHIIEENDTVRNIYVGGSEVQAILRLPEKGESSIEESNTFHELSYRADLKGSLVVRRGALSYLVDDAGNYLSKGYHDIDVKDGKFIGTLGATSETVTLK